ncbi:MAG: DUF6261 family protein [Bacteroidales bacterium]|jgi:hypothetical protein|nr:DUF6261 family protein [Bacteroidales bacterium]
MRKIIVLRFVNLPNAAHFDYCRKVSRELAAAGIEVKTALSALIPVFDGWLEEEDAQMRYVRKSALTVKIADSRRRVGYLLSAISAQIRNALYSPDPPVRDAARRLKIMLKSYGNVSRKPYNEEAGDVQAIIEQIDGDYAADAALVGLDARFAALKSAGTAFVALLEQRDTDRLKKPDHTFQAVRRGIEAAYRDIAAIVNSGAALNLSPEYGAFMDTLNPEIERLNLQFHRARRDMSAAQPAPIPPQAYTGAPVTPVPEVRYVTAKGAVALKLGRDYNIAYRNNVNAGNAECTFRGKGSYRGSVTVTFAIVR